MKQPEMTEIESSRWARLLGSLAISGRGAETLAGLRFAHAQGAPATLWHEVLLAATLGQAPETAAAIAEEGAVRHPGDPELWAAAAIHRLSSGDLAGARGAADRALFLNDSAPASWLADAQVALAEDDRRRARIALFMAKRLGAPAELFASFSGSPGSRS